MVTLIILEYYIVVRALIEWWFDDFLNTKLTSNITTGNWDYTCLNAEDHYPITFMPILPDLKKDRS